MVLLKTIVFATAAFTLLPLTAKAQEIPTVQPSTFARSLRITRVNALQTERTHGFVLLGWGATSMLAGGIIALSQVDGERGIAIGVNTLVWGAINTAISIPFLLSIPREHTAALRDETLANTDLLQRRESAIQRAHSQATVFALNTGLDVAYITAGAFVLVLAANNVGPRPWMEGIGISAISQGAFLFAFDLAGWIMANQRTSSIMAINPTL